MLNYVTIDDLFLLKFSFNHKSLNSLVVSLRYIIRIFKGFTKLNNPTLCRITLSSAVPESTISKILI